jgi:hypothetical protein
MNVLGGGSYGSVHRATVREKTVAAKVFHHQEITPEAYDDFVNEVEILRYAFMPAIWSLVRNLFLTENAAKSTIPT